MCIALGLLKQRHAGDTSAVELVSFESDSNLMKPEAFCDAIVSTYMNLTKNTFDFRWFVHFFVYPQARCARRAKIADLGAVGRQMPGEKLQWPVFGRH